MLTNESFILTGKEFTEAVALASPFGGRILLKLHVHPAMAGTKRAILQNGFLNVSPAMETLLCDHETAQEFWDTLEIIVPGGMSAEANPVAGIWSKIHEAITQNPNQ